MNPKRVNLASDPWSRLWKIIDPLDGSFLSSDATNGREQGGEVFLHACQCKSGTGPDVNRSSAVDGRKRGPFDS